jgi:hypothetical protein
MYLRVVLAHKSGEPITGPPAPPSASS